jgi:hypothetical protein
MNFPANHGLVTKNCVNAGAAIPTSGVTNCTIKDSLEADYDWTPFLDNSGKVFYA